jgi:predicted enzyme related to lactoylglutathione lyase
MKKFKNAISWFEIPAGNIERAQAFYEQIFGVELSPLDLPNIRMRLFPLEDPMTGIGGSICESGGFHRPSATDGPLIYLNGNPDLQLVLDKIEKAGGKILVPKTQISREFGYMAVFSDTEGNRIALHSI